MTTKSSETTSKAASQPTEQATPTGGTRLRWNTSNLKSSYANVCTMTSTRE